jgi:hypothetical protein
MVQRACTKTFDIIQRIVDFRYLEESMNASGLCKVIEDVLLRKLQQHDSTVGGTQKDSCSTNHAALELMRSHGHFEKHFELFCVSHMVSNTIKKLWGHLAVVTRAMHTWNILIGSDRFCSIFKLRTGSCVHGTSAIRWGVTTTQVLLDWHPNKANIGAVVDEVAADDHCARSSAAFREVLDDYLPEWDTEMAAVVDVGKVLLELCNAMEGDGIEFLFLDDWVSRVLDFLKFDSASFVGVKITKIFGGKTFTGTVTEVNDDSEPQKRQWSLSFKVVYSDGDAEDLDLPEILSLAQGAAGIDIHTAFPGMAMPNIDAALAAQAGATRRRLKDSLINSVAQASWYFHGQCKGIFARMLALARDLAAMFRPDLAEPATVRDVYELGKKYPHVFPGWLVTRMVEEFDDYKAQLGKHRVTPLACTLAVAGRDAQFWQREISGSRLQQRDLCGALASALGIMPAGVECAGVEKTKVKSREPAAIFSFNITVTSIAGMRAVQAALSGCRQQLLDGLDAALGAVGGWPAAARCRSLKCTELSLLHLQMDGIFKFWKLHGSHTPAWSEACQRAFAFTPSSATVERLFSVLKASFSKLQESSLVDYVSLCVMLQFHKRAVCA